MKKLMMLVLVLGFVVTASTASADAGMDRKTAKLKMVADYARAVEVFTVDGRTFLLQANPTTELEKQVKIYWLWKKVSDLQKQVLLATW